MVRTNLQEFGGDVHVLSNLQVGSNLFANDLAANVLSIAGNVAAEYFIGDGGFLSNIATTLDDIISNPNGNSVSNTVVFISGQDPIANTAIVTYANVGISVSNTNPSGEYQLSIGSNIFVNTHASNVLTIIGSVGANTFIGDGGLLSNIATTIDQIIDQGNTVSNTLQLISGMDATSNTGLVTHKDVGISVSNVNPTGEFQFGVGSNLFVNTYSSNVLSIEGNVNAQKMTLGTIAVTSAYGLNHVTAQGSATGDTISLTNATTGLSADSNIVVGGNVTAQTVITSANVEVGDRLKFASNVFVDDLRIADLAANLVTYDKTTGELMDSGGLFANKLAVVSVQPPSALSANVTTVAKHGTYTLTTSGLLAGSNTWNAFDGAAVEWTSVGPYDAGGGVYSGTSNLFAGNAGDWLAIEFPYKTTLRHMKLTPPAIVASYPASANIYATNDSLTWTEVAQWGDVDPVTSSNVQTIIVNASESYKRYAMVATKSNGSTSNVALGEWKLFAESFSIDGGQISMAQQPTTGGETVMEQSGPHGRGAAVLKKYPEIVFESGKFDSNESTNTYVQAGYTVTASSSNAPTYSPIKAFNGIISGDDAWTVSGSPYQDETGGDPGAYNAATYSTTVLMPTSTSIPGEYIQIKLPNKIKPTKFGVASYSVGNDSLRQPNSGVFAGSNDGTTWYKLVEYSNETTWTRGAFKSFIVTDNIDTTYEYIRFIIRRVGDPEDHTGVTLSDGSLSIHGLELYGYEEDIPLGDTSVDTTFTSIMNTPQTTGANVYVDGSLGETFTNRVVGPTVSNTHTTYVSAEKYWELSGNVESNVTLEANTFLSGDAPHSISMWFNSSNLEANVSNSCIFSLATEEKLDSVNLDLQSNTWHNLTYAYQGEGGSKVTYLDGRKVAEDQAEDTFGDYPPFAMSGYSQGGYVVSASSEPNPSGFEVNWEPWDAFDGTVGGVSGHISGSNYTTANPGTYNGTDANALLGTRADTGADIVEGDWLKIEIPHKLVTDYLQIYASTDEPDTFKLYGSNDDIVWTELLSVTGNTTLNTYLNYPTTTKGAFKYFAFVASKNGSTAAYWRLDHMKLYGHRENDLVRLPDPTNVLKYPHVAMTGPAQRGYVVTESSYAQYNTNLGFGWKAFNSTRSSSSSEFSWQTDLSTYSSGNARTGVAVETITENSNTHVGSWVTLETPHKVQVSSVELTCPVGIDEYRPNSVVILGSDNNSTWNFLTGDISSTYTNDIRTITINSTVAYKYHMLLVKTIGSVGAGYATTAFLSDIRYYGTGVDSIPLRIGGGNIDKVANFRVYDKFVGEDQALEIWDAQKDEFGRAKSSMTLHKGRLGIGTTEPEGRLAVADEPHAPEKEFPPRAGGFDGDEWYIEGHGTFKACTSNYHETTDYYPGRAFTKSLVQNFGFATLSDGTVARWSGNNGLPNQSSSDLVGTFQGHQGDWLELELPYRIRVKSFQIQTRLAVNSPGDHPKNGFLYGSNNRENWTQVTEFTNLSYTPSQLDGIGGQKAIWNIDSETGFKYLRLLTTQKIDGSDAWLMISELKYFGTREQGQSVLHDGQLTLTKSLNVPRIGPALDADDTPRRDRLVVEYNTSTNPTFEGAVRDTSGRGNDGVMYGTAAYNSTSKDLYFDGNSDFIETDLGKEVFKNSSIHTTSLWVKMNHHDASQQILFSLGQGTGANLGHVNLYYTDNFGLRLSFEQHDYRLGEVVPIGQWVHVAYTYDGTTWQNTTTPTNVNIYINGVKVGITSVYEIAGGGGSALDLSVAQLALGAASTNATGRYYTDADLSQFKLYDTVLTAEEVKTLYDMGRCDEGHHVVNFSKTRVGIGLGDGEAPRGALDVRDEVYINKQVGPLELRQVVDNTPLQSFIIRAATSGFGYWGMYVTAGNDFSFHQNGSDRGALVSGVNVSAIDFTGQHRNFIDGVSYANYDSLEGLIVSANKNKYYDIDENITAGANAIQISQSLPLVALSNVALDKACFGVISGVEDPDTRKYEQGTFVTVLQKQRGDRRAFINSVGEGAIWVVNTNGSLESGDYITTSNVAGYGQKQNDDVLHNYTVAKITMDCDFEPVTQPVQQILRSNVVETYYLGNVHKVKSVPHEFVTTVVSADDDWSNVSVSPSDVTYAEWSNLEANTQNTYTLTYTQTSNVVYDTKYTLTTTANVTESDAWDRVSIEPPGVTYAEYSNLEANTQSSYSLTFTKTTTDEKTPDEWSALESNVQSLYNKVYYQSVEEEVAKDYPGAVAHTRVTDVIENELDEHGQIQWEDHATETEKAYKIRYLDVSGAQTDSANAVHIAAFVGCTYHCG
jgi:hypothetical protein